MLRHIVLARWKPEATDAQKQAVRDALAALPSQISEIVAFRFGDDVRRKANSYDLGAVVDFADREAFARYLAHPAHCAYADGPGKAAVASLASRAAARVVSPP